MVTFDCDFLFFFLSFLASIRAIRFFFFFSSFPPLHTRIPIPVPTPLKSHLVFIFLELFLHTTCPLTPLCFYFSFFISSSLFLILFLSYSHPVTHTRQRIKLEFKAMMLEMAVAELKACFT